MNDSLKNYTFSGSGISGSLGNSVSSGSSNIFINGDDNITEDTNHRNLAGIIAFCIFLGCCIIGLLFPIIIICYGCYRKNKKTYGYPGYYNYGYSDDGYSDDGYSDDDDSNETSFEMIVSSFVNLFSNNIENKDLRDDCSICFEKLNKNNTIKLSCNHKFHKSCLEKYILINNNYNFDCPLCRDKYFIKNV